MLHGLRLIDIGNHKDTTLRLGPVTAILGPNGSGKTTVLKAIELLCQTEPPLGEVIWTRSEHLVRDALFEGSLLCTFCPASTRHHSLAVCRNLQCHQTFNDTSELPTLELSSMWAVQRGDNLQGWLPSQYDSIWQPDRWDFDIYKPLATHLLEKKLEPGVYSASPQSISELYWARPVVRRVHFSSGQLKSPSASEEVVPAIADDGTGLSSVLAHLMTSDRPAFSAILESIQKVVPTVRDIRATRCPITIREPRSVTVNKKDVPYFEDRKVIGQQLRFDMASGHDLPADRISDGTMLVLAIVTLLKTMPGAMILLDDIEQGLHPSAQRQVIQLIKTIQKDHPSTQIVFTTHSPYVVDEMDPEHVWVMGLDKEGCAHAKALSEHPKAAKAMEVLTAGEFWSAEGEDWVVPETTEA